MSASPQLILASQSPRREYLLKQAGLHFSVIPSRIDEGRFQLTDPGDYVKTLARAKADDVARQYPESWVIGADTIVTIGQSILGKPQNIEDAKAMLRRLSGQSHAVFTGYAIVNRKSQRHVCEAVETTVVFKDLSNEEIDWYAQSDEPFDKAGAYAIQGLGTFLVRRIDGSYTNVVGLPVCEVIETLLGLGAIQVNREVVNGVKS